MTRSMRLAVLSLFVVTGCSLATDFDRFHIGDQKGNVDAGGDKQDGGGDGDHQPPQDSGMDSGDVPLVDGEIRVQLADGALGTVTSEPAGIDCAGDCSEVYTEGTEVVLTAHPDATGAFVGWGGACEGQKGLTCTLVAGDPLIVTAAFTADWFDVTVSRLGGGSGAVESEDEMLRCDGAPDEICVVRYPHGAIISLTATPSPDGSSFSGWGGSCAGEGACSLEMTGDKVINAVFDANGQVSLIVSKAGNGGGVVTSDDVTNGTPNVNCGIQCAASYVATDNKVVTLSAQADGSSDFVKFDGDCVPQPVVAGQPPKCVATMSAVRHVTATFALKKHTFSLAWSGDGEGSVHMTSPKDLTCTKPDACSDSFDHNTMLHLEALPAEGSTFKQWSLGTCGTNTTCEFPIVANATVFATFEVNEFNFNAGSTGSGTTVCTVDGKNSPCPSPGTYKFGTQVIVNAAPAPGNQLDSWQGDCAGQPASGPCTLTVTKDTSVVAAFKKKSYQVTVKFGNTGGHGSVSGDVSCNDQQGTCSISVQHGDGFDISAMAANDSDFVAFTGDCNGDTCSVASVQENLSITVSFSLKAAQTKTLVVAKSDGGTVTSSPGGISCGATCVTSFTVDTDVVLTGTPATGYGAAQFSGDCSGTGTCNLKMSDAKSVNVNFPPLNFALNASVTGPGSLSFAAQTGLNCNDTNPDGPDCSESLPFGSKITVRATPGQYGIFSGWTGACQGVLSTDCEVTIGQSNTVGATFTTKQFNLSVKLAGEGLSPGKLVTGNGVSCGMSGDNCSVTLPALTGISLATASAPWASVTNASTDQVGVACGGAPSACSFQLKGDTVVTFEYTPKAALVFVTSGVFSAVFASDPDDPTPGVQKADDQCTALAGTVAGLQGRWVAWLSDGKGGVGGRMKRMQPGTPVMNLNGEYVMAKGYEAVTFGAVLDKPIMVTESGSTLRPPADGTIIPVWTGTLRSGQTLPDDKDWCANWTSATGYLKYGIGDAYDGFDGKYFKSKAWTHNESYDDSSVPVPFIALPPPSPCGGSAHLYCFRDWSPKN
ncbi:MAG: hypothetical protein QM778_32785 [Myxococcales bacterium]